MRTFWVIQTNIQNIFIQYQYNLPKYQNWLTNKNSSIFSFSSDIKYHNSFMRFFLILLVSLQEYWHRLKWIIKMILGKVYVHLEWNTTWNFVVLFFWITLFIFYHVENNTLEDNRLNVLSNFLFLNFWSIELPQPLKNPWKSLNRILEKGLQFLKWIENTLEIDA